MAKLSTALMKWVREMNKAKPNKNELQNAFNEMVSAAAEPGKFDSKDQLAWEILQAFERSESDKTP